MFRFGTEWMLTPFRLAVYLPTKTAVIADPHLGYRDARRLSGDAIPLGADDELGPLRSACAALDLAELIVAGDLCEARLDDALVSRFTSVVADLGLQLKAIVPGNHDRGWLAFRDSLPIFPDGFKLGDWTVHHGDRIAPPGPTVMGHVHPAWRTVKEMQPCFLVRPNRIVLPAFSLDAAGGAINRSPLFSGHQAISIDGQRLVDRGIINAKRPRRNGLRGRLS